MSAQSPLIWLTERSYPWRTGLVVETRQNPKSLSVRLKFGAAGPMQRFSLRRLRPASAVEIGEKEGTPRNGLSQRLAMEWYTQQKELETEGLR